MNDGEVPLQICLPASLSLCRAESCLSAELPVFLQRCLSGEMSSGVSRLAFSEEEG